MSRTIRLCACVLFLSINFSAYALVPLRPRPWLEETWTTKTVENSLGMTLVRIEPGVFLMGAPATEAGRQNQETQHEVAITKPFYLGKFEVTQGEFERLMGINPSAFSPTGQQRQRVAGLDTRRFPVEMLTWHEAKAFCKRLTDKERAEGRITLTMTYALPTEAEWEYCCRAGTQTPFCFGQNIPLGKANCQGNGNDLNRTTTVGSYPPNAWGLCDMHGNAWEYCEDSYDVMYYSKSPRLDPFNTNGANCILRGGGFGVNQTLCRSALRGSNGRDTRFDYNGFRVVLRLGK
jgi:formylglycine-generating enzyme required for sulfatase activity